MDRFPRKNLTAKILAVIFATMLWMYVVNEQNPPIEATYQVPLEVRNLSGNLVIAEVPDFVRVKVRGPRSVVAAVNVQDIKSYIDVKGLAEGQHSAKVHTAIPANLEVVEVGPDKVMLRIDSAGSRQVPVEIKLLGAPSMGVAVGKAVPSVDQVTVEGPRSLLEAMDKIIARIDVSGHSSDFSIEAPLTAINHDGQQIEGLTISPAKISVAISVNGANRKVVDIKTILMNEFPKDISLKHITTDPDKVELFGDAQLLAKIDVVYTEPINLARIDKDTDMEVKLQLKEGITVKKNTIMVHISIDKK